MSKDLDIESYDYFYCFPSSLSYSAIYDRIQRAGGKEGNLYQPWVRKKIETLQAGRHLIQGIRCLQEI